MSVNEENEIVKSNILTKGIKTSEFWVVLLILTPWILQQLGVDIGAAIQSADDLKEAINAAHQNSGDLPVWVAMLYVVGRKVLKWQQKA